MAQRVDDWDFNFPQVPSDALPTDVFSAARTMTVSRSTLALKHHPAAHTDSDISGTR
jgi:hypothetical protein